MDVKVKNRAGLPADRLEALKADLSLLEKSRMGLGERAFRYAADGDEGDVVNDIAATTDAHEVLHLTCSTQTYNTHKAAELRSKKIFAGLDADSAFLLRMADIYEAASRNAQRKLAGGPFGLPEWLECFLIEATLDRYSADRNKGVLEAAAVEQMLSARGAPADLAVRTLVNIKPRDWNCHQLANVLRALKGMGAAMERCPAPVLEVLSTAPADQRVHVLEMMATLGASPEPFLEKLIELGVSSAKTVREAALPLLKKAQKRGVEAAQAKVTSGSNDERIQAVALLWQLAGEGARDFLKQRLTEETGAKVKQAITNLLATPEASAGDDGAAAITLRPLPPVQLNEPIPQEARLALRKAFDKHHDELLTHHQRYPQGKPPTPIDDADLGELFRRLETLQASDASLKMPVFDSDWRTQQTLQEFVKRPELKPIHAVRLAVIMNAIGVNKDGRTNVANEWIMSGLFNNYARTHGDQADLRLIAAAFDTIGVKHRPLALSILNTSRWERSSYPPARTWGYYAEHPDVLEEVFNLPKDYHTDARRASVFAVLAHFPQLPPKWLAMMWDLALGGSKKERALAQACLEKVSGKEQRIAAALTDGKADTRAIAAEWLGRIGASCRELAVSALKTALKKEKQELAAGAMMSALERLGVPIDEFVNFDTLAADARKFLAKGAPANLAWFKFDLLPRVHWSATSKQVEPDILKYLIANACKLGNPEPGPMLRRYCSYFRKSDAEELGQHVLQAWIGQDTIPHSHEDAHAYATPLAKTYAGWAKSHPQLYGDKDEAQWYQQFYNQKLKEPVGTATREKGILAVAGACCGGRAAPVATQYLKTWYGMRVHQCKALLHMLAFIEHPSAIQVLLATSARFRTASIRKEAEALVSALADRKGWTLDELADRTIPTGGFDDVGELTIDYGPRKFLAKLDENFNVTITNDEGKVIKSLPDPRQGEDEEQVKDAKKILSGAKKEITSILKLQKERLFEAMCTQRSWTFADWDTYLNKHPILKRYAQRLVWASVDDKGKVTGTLRPLEDASLTDTNDESVTLPSTASVRLAHSATVPAEAATAWRQHFSDYNVEPLFPQFSASPYALPDNLKEESDISDFLGHMLQAFKLRTRLTKAGYTRGQAEDGGWFHVYKKNFPSLHLEAIIEFTGNALPETDRPVALQHLYFSRTGDPQSGEAGGGYGEDKIPLGEVPRVLLSECYNDLRTAASEGKGLDPDWEKKAFA
jgi:hypothetical protein